MILANVAADGVSRTIIFCSSKRGCEVMRTDLRRRGYAAEALHGDKSQQERDWVLLQFKQGSAPVLIATDVRSIIIATRCPPPLAYHASFATPRPQSHARRARHATPPSPRLL